MHEVRGPDGILESEVGQRPQPKRKRQSNSHLNRPIEGRPWKDLEVKIRLLVVLALSLVIGLGAALQAQTSSDVTTFIKTYANFLKNVQLDQTPEDVQATSDGGYILCRRPTP